MKLKLFWATLQFMTRLPVPAKWAQGIDFRQLGRGVPVFPLIGLIVGVIASCIALAISQSGGGVYIGAIGYALALALLTGGLHLDGLADTCDGIFSSRQRERMLEIMQDSRLGTYGGLALIFCILIKILVVVELAYHPPLKLLALLSCAPVVGRTVVVLLMFEQRYARENEGMGSSYIGRITPRGTILVLLTGTVLVMILGDWQGLSAMMVTMIAIFLLSLYFNYRLGGQTGDTMGAAIEIGEVVFLLTLILIWK
ncbi:adenosylcobinamide-GDP ribazoletransferase [Xenorhabdus budapestensis]|uniref:Adenosylcobinamide-GDP ribazoletransferase n=1 Tax=Xenorhabdus budapestensis TaxID=290110 RepID=A0A2D0ITH3_XENBU|nr:adenosylcobinamide-GDP ribazoletransferase [Xenorhabdus budapestensis]PHM25166.1 cobalamin synthase [Xenorhabdus budapestensis]QTL39173.1 adenosylcobinamide-GDP ribazoletransferase [Xenorhabdus budapestensis]